jgi:short-subunit dehydrogenase
VTSWPVAAVTGASSGIGRALAAQLAARGSAVALLARRADALEETAALVRAAGGRAAVCPCDVRDGAATAAALAAAAAQLGPIDLLVANSGIAVPAPAHRYDAARIADTFETNVIGVTNAIAAVLPAMLERRSGHLVGISSILSFRALASHAPYCASKVAVNFLLEGLRTQVAPRGVRVTTVCPGFVETPMTERNRHPMPGLVTADDAAERILRGVERGKRFIAFPAHVALLMRIVRLLPAPVWERIARKVG